MYAFYDPEQNIFGREFGFLVNEAKITLDKNCRNTNQIAKYVSRLSTSAMESAHFAEEGFAPTEHVVDSAEGELDAVEKIVSDLINKKKFSPDKIVIIGRRRLQNSPYADCARLAGVRLIDESSGEHAPAAIRYATIYRFKGLEADCVILSGFNRPNPTSASTELYCAASRAKFLLHIFSSGLRLRRPAIGQTFLVM